MTPDSLPLPSSGSNISNSSAYYLLCDESDAKGKFYSDFFGGVLVRAAEFKSLEYLLQCKKDNLNLHAEVKWSKLTERYLSKYQELIGTFFSFVRNGSIKVRIMFRSNQNEPSERRLSRDDERYYKLYYQFIKHGFGLAHRPPTEGGYSLIPLFDQFPHTTDQTMKFKRFIANLPNTTALENSGLKIDPRHVIEVKSHEYALLQCLDIVLGSMSFRLNRKWESPTKSLSEMGKKTRAKGALHKEIVRQIRKTHPAFRCSVSTPCKEYPSDLWKMSYRHWDFTPK